MLSARRGRLAGRYVHRMSRFLPGALSIGRRALTYAGVGFLLAGGLGVLLVVIGWLPSALADFAEHPHYVNPWTTVLVWAAAWGVCLGLLGGAMGFAIGLIPVGGAAAPPTSVGSAPVSSEAQHD